MGAVSPTGGGGAGGLGGNVPDAVARETLLRSDHCREILARRVGQPFDRVKQDAPLSVVEEYDLRPSCPLTVRKAPHAMAGLPQARSMRPVSCLATCGPLIVPASSARDWL